MFSQFGKILISIGALMIFVGGVFLLINKVSGMGKLPGDIFIQRGNFTFYFPITTAILISIVLSIILNLVLRR